VKVHRAMQFGVVCRYQ